MKCKPNSSPGGALYKQNQTGELLWRNTGGIHWRILASRSGSILAGYSEGSTGKGYSADTRRDPLASYSGILSRMLGGCCGGILGGIHWRATLAGYSAGSTGELLLDTQRDTRRDPLASRSGGILAGAHWRAALAGYWAGSTGEPLWWDTRRDPKVASCSGGILGGIHWSCSGGILGGGVV